VNKKWQKNFDKLCFAFFQFPLTNKYKLASHLLLTKDIDDEFVFFFERWLIRHSYISGIVPESFHIAHHLFVEEGTLVELFVHLVFIRIREAKTLIGVSDDTFAVFNMNMIFSQELIDAMLIICKHGNIDQGGTEIIVYTFIDFLDFSDIVLAQTKQFFMLENIQGDKKKVFSSEIITFKECSSEFKDLIILKNYCFYLESLLKKHYLDFPYVELLLYYTQRAKSTCPRILEGFLNKMIDQVKSIKKRWLDDYGVESENSETSKYISFYIFNSTFFGLPNHLIVKLKDRNSPLLLGDQIILRTLDMKFKLLQIYSTVKNEFHNDVGSRLLYVLLTLVYKIFSKFGLVGQPFTFYESINHKMNKVLEMWNMGLRERALMVTVQGDNYDSIFHSSCYEGWRTFILNHFDERNGNPMLIEAFKKTF
jgi:hypothetical protein